MRPRDYRLIGVWFASTLMLIGICGFAIHSIVITLGLMIAYQTWFLSRPRTIRVMRRMRGEDVLTRQSYFID